MSLSYPGSPAGLSALKQLARSPGEALIAFDYDGTLAPIVTDPENAHAHPGAVPALQELASLVGSIAVVTGRPAAAAVRLGGLDAVDGLVVLGQYGRERWEAGEVAVPEAPPGVELARGELPDLLLRAAAPSGTWIEDKGQALAVHTRRTADPDTALELLREPLAQLALRADLALEPGRMVVELRPRGMDKGAALTQFAAERVATSVLYAGDDLGDLAAFDAVERLRASGVPGVTVCSGSAEVAELADRADIVVDGPGGVVRFLHELTEVLNG